MFLLALRPRLRLPLHRDHSLVEQAPRLPLHRDHSLVDQSLLFHLLTNIFKGEFAICVSVGENSLNHTLVWIFTTTQDLAFSLLDVRRRTTFLATIILLGMRNLMVFFRLTCRPRETEKNNPSALSVHPPQVSFQYIFNLSHVPVEALIARPPDLN